MMNTIELFEGRDFTGDSISINRDTPNLEESGFLNRAQSLKVNGDPWIVFTENGYKGDFRCFQQGNHRSIPAFERKISSVREVKGGLLNPHITLYEHINYGGKVVPLRKPADSLKPYGFNNMASSHKVESGAWVLFSEEFYRGAQMITLAGDKIPDYRTIGWNDVPSSVRPFGSNEAYDAAL